MDDAQLLRYSRHILLDAVGVELSRKRVRKAKALQLSLG